MKGVLIALGIIGSVMLLACGGCLVLIANMPKPTAEQIAKGKESNKVFMNKIDADKMTRDCIRDVLKAPTTAKFELECREKDGKVYLVNGTVTAQNGFGAMITQQVQAMYLLGKDGFLDIATVMLDGKATHEDKDTIEKCNKILDSAGL